VKEFVLAKMGVLISDVDGSILSACTVSSTFGGSRYCIAHLREARLTSASVPPSRYPSPGTSSVNVHDSF
jgi:hypothetical protein